MRPINSIKKCNRPMNCNKNKLNGEKIRLFKPIPNTHLVVWRPSESVYTSPSKVKLHFFTFKCLPFKMLVIW